MRISDWSSDVCSSDLIVALKMRFLHLMEPAERRVQAELLHEICERELARLIDLRAYHGEEPGHLCAWLDSAIAQTRARLDWFAGLRSEEHTSELQSLMRISYAVFCLQKKKIT